MNSRTAVHYAIFGFAFYCYVVFLRNLSYFWFMCLVMCEALKPMLEKVRRFSSSGRLALKYTQMLAQKRLVQEECKNVWTFQYFEIVHTFLS